VVSAWRSCEAGPRIGPVFGSYFERLVVSIRSNSLAAIGSERRSEAQTWLEAKFGERYCGASELIRCMVPLWCQPWCASKYDLPLFLVSS
jgi:hypothetical protein